MGLIGDAFTQQIANLHGSTDQLSSRMAGLTDRLRQQARDLGQVGEEASTQVRDVGNNLGRQTQTLVQATADARTQIDSLTEKVEHHRSNLLSTTDEVVAKTSEASTHFDQHAAVLSQAAADAADQAERLKEQDLSGRRNVFLKTARYIIEDLHSTAVDLTRLLNEEVPDADWKRYVKGDRSIFTRMLLKNRPSATASLIAQKVQQEEEMRRYVMRYFDHFERLLKDSQEVDPENLLHSTFMTADVGKLYLLLCRALGRDIVLDE